MRFCTLLLKKNLHLKVKLVKDRMVETDCDFFLDVSLFFRYLSTAIISALFGSIMY